MAVTARHLDRGWSVGVGWVDLVGWLFLIDVSAVFVVWLSLRLCQSMFAFFFWLLFGVFFFSLGVLWHWLFHVAYPSFGPPIDGSPMEPPKIFTSRVGFRVLFCLPWWLEKCPVQTTNGTGG